MKRIAAALGAAAAVAAAVAWWLRSPEESAPPPPEPPRILAHATAEPTRKLPEAPAARKLAELRAMSESVRNSTFVIAIRGAGFVCEDVIGVDQAERDAPAWRAHCPGLLAYLLSVRDDGALGVEPTLDHWDGVAPVIPVRPAPQINPPDLLAPREPQR